MQLFGSRRFWLLTVGALAALGAAWSGDTLTLQITADVVVTWLGAIVAVGTIDKFGTSK